MPIPYPFDYYSFVVLFEISVVPPALLILLKIALAIKGVLWFHISIRIIHSILVKNAMEFLEGLYCISRLGYYGQVDNILRREISLCLQFLSSVAYSFLYTCI